MIFRVVGYEDLARVLRDPVMAQQFSKLNRMQLKLELMQRQLTLLVCADLSASLRTGISLCRLQQCQMAAS